LTIECFECGGAASLTITAPFDPLFRFYFCSECFWSGRAAEAVSKKVKTHRGGWK